MLEIGILSHVVLQPTYSHVPPITLLVASVLLAFLELFERESVIIHLFHLLSVSRVSMFKQQLVNVQGNFNLMIRHWQEARVLVLRPASADRGKVFVR